jgi:2-polyprenyl-6-methoxyphenol hydroxylase-like FAD-dependent oxidoreductase
MFALGDSKALIGHRDANAHFTIYAGMPIAENCMKDVSNTSWTAHFDGWSDDLLQLIYKAPCTGEKMTPRPIYTLPVGHRWQHRPGITLIGDAAHLMAPFSGEGANLAMLDAADLALALARDDDWKRSVHDFEEKMLARAEEAAAGANDALHEVFSEDGLAHLLCHMQQHRGRRRARCNFTARAEARNY